MKMMKFIIFEPLELDFSCRAMFKVTRRAFKLQRCSYRVIRVQGGASWRDPRLVAKLAGTPQNDDFSGFKSLQCEIRKFVWALTLGKRYFKILSVEWFKSQALVKQRAGEFNSFSLSHERPFFMKIMKIMKIIIFEPPELDAEAA